MLQQDRKGRESKCGRAPLALALVMVGIVFSSTTASAQALRKDSGKDLFQQHCASCHFTETAAQKIGPGLKGLYPRLTFSDGKKVTDASLTKWIEAGGKNMPGFKENMKPEQIRELISYIKTL